MREGERERANEKERDSDQHEERETGTINRWKDIAMINDNLNTINLFANNVKLFQND